MTAIFAGSTQYVPVSTTKNLHTGAGKIRSIIVSGDGLGTITFYDNTAASGTVLMVLDVGSYYATPGFINLYRLTPITFTTGLTIVTTAHARCFVITEA